MWRIQEWQDKISWNVFLLSLSTQAGLFQQSWEWLQFQGTLGRKAKYIAIQNQDAVPESKQLRAVLGLTHLPLPLGKRYWYSPRGPIMHDLSNADEFFSVFKEISSYINKNIARSSDVFWRHEPLANTAPLHRGISGYGKVQPLEATSLKTRGGQYIIGNSVPTEPVQPEKTLIVDLSESDEKLFAAMHEKTRYNIRLAIKKEVRVAIEPATGKPLEQFITMLSDTAARNGFRMHDADYYRHMGQSFNSKNNDRTVFSLQLAMAYAGDKPIAGALLGFFGDTVTYLHGASDHDARSLMGPFVLHWEAMRYARKEGYGHYDFWGIDAQKWPGVTRFKMGFGGQVVEYPGTFDLPLNSFWYKLYRAARSLRRM